MTDYTFLQTLCQLSGISGREEAVRSAIERVLPADCVAGTDALGNLTVEKKGKKRPLKKLMVCAHMDEVGMIVTSITASGLLRFVTVGGIDEKVLAGISVLVGENKIPGVITVKPMHLCDAEEAGKPVPKESLRIDIGAKDRKDAEQWVHPGDAVVFVSRFEETATQLRGKALDDRAGCAILTKLLWEEAQYDWTAVFTVQEEVGLRGARAAAFSVAPELAIVLESTTAADLAGVAEENCVAKLGEGPTVSFMDRTTIYDRGLFRLAWNIAEQENLPIQTKRAVSGGNDAGAIHVSRGGVRTLTVSLPCRYLHAPMGVIAKADYQAAIKLVYRLIEQMAGGNA